MRWLLVLALVLSTSVAAAQSRRPRKEPPPDLARPTTVEVSAPPRPAAPPPAEPAAAAAAAPPRERRAGPCRRGPSGIPLDPVRTSLGDSDLAAPRRPCARTEVGLVTRLGAQVDGATDYSSLRATAVAEGSYALQRLELFATAELFAYESAATATLEARSFGLGQATAGASYLLHDGDGAALALSGRLLLPTTTLAANIRTVGASLSAPAAYALTDATFLHGEAGVDLTAGIGGPALPHFGLRLVAGGEWHPTATFALAGDLTVRSGTRAVLEELTPAIAARLRAGKRWWVELSGALPIAGARGLGFEDGFRAAPVGLLRVSYRP